jgi:hypothetical protein
MRLRIPITYTNIAQKPKEGDITYGSIVNIKPFARQFKWRIYEGCHKGAWAFINKGILVHQRCKHCRLGNGRFVTAKGYINVYVNKNNPFRPMAQKSTGYVFEHRLIMARHLGRCLKSWEVVHHINRNKQDNRIENLLLLSTDYSHIPDARLKSHINYLETKVAYLEDILQKSGISLRKLKPFANHGKFKIPPKRIPREDISKNHFDIIKGRKGYWHVCASKLVNNKVRTLCDRTVTPLYNKCSLKAESPNLLSLINYPKCINQHLTHKKNTITKVIIGLDT